MSKIREDIFPEIEGYDNTQSFLQRLAEMTFQALDGLFSSKDEVVQYINNFCNAEIAKEFLEITEFYYSAKFYYCPNCFPPKRIDECPHCKQNFEMPAYIVLIMIVSIMERLSRCLDDYVDFFEWTDKKEVIDKFQTKLDLSGEKKEAQEFISNLREEWRRNYGSVTKITEFFDKFLEKEEKIKFIKSIRYFMKVPELPPKHLENVNVRTHDKVEKIIQDWEKTIEKEEQLLFKSDEDVKRYVANNNSVIWEALPVCFNKEQYWTCYGKDHYHRGTGYCRYNYHCPLYSDEKVLSECFKKTVKTVYDWRSKFAHNAQIPPITETAIHGGVYNGKKTLVELTTTELKPVFERMLKRYFDDYQMKQ
jgi:hypothetical protein